MFLHSDTLSRSQQFGSETDRSVYLYSSKLKDSGKFMMIKFCPFFIVEITAKDGKLITGGLSKNLCLWSVSGVAGLRDPEEHQG